MRALPTRSPVDLSSESYYDSIIMKVRKAVFPAAGLGTRFLPATKAIPKEMLPLVDKPLIQYTVEEAKQSGIEEIILVTGMGKGAIEDHFDTSVELEQFLKAKGKKKELAEIREITRSVHYAYTRQKEPKGLGDAVGTAKLLVGDEPFAVILGDDIIDARVPATKQLLRVYEKYRSPVIAVQRVPKSQAHLYGIVSGKKVGAGTWEVESVVEKPKNPPSTLAIIGRYIFTPDIFGAIESTKPGRGGEIQLTDSIRLLMKKRPVYALEFEGDRYDAGDKAGFLKANVIMALKRQEMRTEIKRFLKGLKL